MTKKQRIVEAMAKRLISEFGLADRFEFVWTNSRENCGLCRDPWAGNIGQIELSKVYVQRASLELIEDTIRHEIAHALVGCTEGHNANWVQACLVVGAVPLEYNDSVVLTQVA